MSDDLVSRGNARIDPTTYHGKEGFLEQPAEWIEGFAESAVAAEEFIDAGDRIAVRNRHRRVVRVDTFVDEREALEAAGLSE